MREHPLPLHLECALCSCPYPSPLSNYFASNTQYIWSLSRFVGAIAEYLATSFTCVVVLWRTRSKTTLAILIQWHANNGPDKLQFSPHLYHVVKFLTLVMYSEKFLTELSLGFSSSPRHKSAKLSYKQKEI